MMINASFNSWYGRLYIKLKSQFLILKHQINPKTIPILIISFNRLKDLKKLVEFLEARKMKNIIIIDNCSTYTPILQYYKDIEHKVTIIRRENNLGHRVFWKDYDLFYRYGLGYYIVTDSDIIPNEKLPDNFLRKMLYYLKKNSNYTKVGFALDTDSIPDSYPLKEMVLKWEKKFWDNQVGENLYEAYIDTTFALYKPRYLADKNFYKGLRIAGDYTAKHGGWYLDPKNMSEEDIYYFKTTNASNSWSFNSDGELNKERSRRYL